MNGWGILWRISLCGCVADNTPSCYLFGFRRRRVASGISGGSPLLQIGKGTPAAPQPHASSPSHGLSRCDSQTQRHPSQRQQIMLRDPTTSDRVLRAPSPWLRWWNRRLKRCHRSRIFSSPISRMRLCDRLAKVQRHEHLEDLPFGASHRRHRHRLDRWPSQHVHFQSGTRDTAASCSSRGTQNPRPTEMLGRSSNS